MRMLVILVACMGFSCTEQENPIAHISPPASKAYVDSDAGERLALSWLCDTEVDSVWTVFYGSDYRFQAHGERILFSHYLTSNKKKQYWASETSTRLGRLRSGFRSGDGFCNIWSEAIDNDTSVVRIYKGDVSYLYRDTPNARYTLLEDDVQYPIAYVEADGSVRHRDFLSFFNRNEPRPADLVKIRSTYHVGAYYLPVNFSAAALDTLTALPEDDRPYLENAICLGDECLEQAEPEQTEPKQAGLDTSTFSCTATSILTYRGTYIPASIDYGTTPDGSDTACGALTPENAFFANDGNCPAGETPGCQRFTPQDGTGDDVHLWLCSACQ